MSQGHLLGTKTFSQALSSRPLSSQPPFLPVRPAPESHPHSPCEVGLREGPARFQVAPTQATREPLPFVGSPFQKAAFPTRGRDASSPPRPRGEENSASNSASDQKNPLRTQALKWRVPPLTPGARPNTLSESPGGPATKNGKCPGKPYDSACGHWNAAGTRPHDLHVELGSAAESAPLTAPGSHPTPTKRPSAREG